MEIKTATEYIIQKAEKRIISIIPQQKDLPVAPGA